MEANVTRPRSVLEKQSPSIAKALPKGLPKPLADFYAAGDGMVVTLGRGSTKETLTIVGVRAMFGRRFAPPTVIDDLDDASDALESGPFQDVFYNAELDLEGGKRALARLNLHLRLRLVVSFEGESAAIGVDLYDPERPAQLYYVQDARDAFPLDLRFDELVRYASRFGPRRFYLAFLDKKAERAMNVDFAAELAETMAPFPAKELAALLARRGKKPTKTAPAATKAKKVATTKANEAATKPAPKSKATPEKAIAQWFLTPPALGLPWLADPHARDRAALLAHGASLVGEHRTIALVTEGLRAWFVKRAWATLDWGAVLLAATELTEDEVVRLADSYMPVEAMVVLAKLRKWNGKKLRALAEATMYAYEKKPIGPHVTTTFAEASKRV